MKKKNTRDIRTPVITVQVELRKSRGGGLYCWCTSSKQAHRSQRIEYSYSELVNAMTVNPAMADPFLHAATSYLSRQGFNEDFGCVVRSHFDQKPDIKIFSFLK